MAQFYPKAGEPESENRRSPCAQDCAGTIEEALRFRLSRSRWLPLKTLEMPAGSTKGDLDTPPAPLPVSVGAGKRAREQSTQAPVPAGFPEAQSPGDTGLAPSPWLAP